MEIKIYNPQIVGYALLLAGVMLLVWRKRKKFRKGIVVANSKYLKKTPYYRYLLVKYHFLNIIIKAVCILAIFTSAYLTARLYKQDQHTEEYYNRDIMLCLDVSGSVWSLDKDMIDKFIDIVSKMKDQRFGLTIFDSSPVTIIPLTDDYDYAISQMKVVQEGFNGSRSILSNPVFAGTRAVSGSSLIGDGLAYCASSFKKDEDRTKVVVLATDNLSGTGIFTLEEAGDFSKQRKVKVYAIQAQAIPKGYSTIGNLYNGPYATDRLLAATDGLVALAQKTNGKYFDGSALSTTEIVNSIETLDKSAIVKESYVTKEDLPQIVFPYLLYIIPILFLLDWRVRI